MQTLETTGNRWKHQTAPNGRFNRTQTAPTPAPDLHQGTSVPATAPAEALDTKATEPRFERYWFRYRGREWRIFKRAAGPMAKWYLYFEHGKERYKPCLGEVEKRAAEETAKIKIDAVLDGHKEVLRQSMMRDRTPACSLVEKLLETYEAAPQEASEATVHRNANCLRLVLRRALAVDDLAGQTAEALNGDTADRYFEDAVRRAKLEANQDEQARVKRSANSVFNQARAVLSAPLLKVYRREGLQLPSTLDKFLAGYDESRFKGVAAQYDPPTEKIIRKTLHAWLQIKDRNVFLAVGLMLSCGLRKGEAQQVRWGMWTHTRDGWLLDGRAWLKHSAHGHLVVPPIDPFWKLMNRRIDREKWRGESDELVLDARNQTDLEDVIFRQVGHWLRDLQWNTQKTNHALRAYAGSLVAMRWGIDRAHSWLRHQSVKTTEQHYTHFLDQRVFRPEKVRCAWAR